VDHTEQWLPELGLLVATPILWNSDQELSEDAQDHHSMTGSSTTGGDAVAIALGVGVFGMGVVEVAHGDEWRSLEVGTEALLVTEAATNVLKAATQRTRPDSTSHTSFPSGHASFSFAAATLLARRIEDTSGSSLGYLFYLPATYVGINRVESGHHWPSDVTAGAFLGLFLTNTIYNAHYGDNQVERPSIFQERPKCAWHIGPAVVDGRPVVEVGLSF
jgi:hypothetical protein